MGERPRTRRRAGDDRGVSVPINYLLVLAIVSILSAALFVTTAGFVEDQQQRAARSELDVVGARLADSLATTDRLARSDPANATVAVDVDLPARVAGATYQLSITDAGADTYRVVGRSSARDTTAVVTVKSRTPVATGTYDGGDLRLAYDPSSGTVEVVDDV